jgi:proteasome accessory factor A
VGERIFGLETEYALAGFSRRGGRVDSTSRSLMALAKRRFPHLPDPHHGIFLQNGGKLYIDAGDHPEFSSPECTNPWDICRYQRAIEAILVQLLDELPGYDGRLQRVTISRSSVSYTGGTTWGCHENYCHTASDSCYVGRQLVPHLVSRVIYTGSGGFDPRSPGLVFMVSPRVAHLDHVVSDNSQKQRGILHTKREPLTRGPWRRCHLLCGDVSLGDTALWLKIAITSLVVALAEAGIPCTDDVQLKDPLRAMQRFAADEKCTARVETKAGRRLTAIDIQRHILGRIEAHADHAVMPPWTAEACRRLRQILERLERGPAEVALTLDWAIKLAVCQEFTRKQGVRWEDLPHWNQVFCSVEREARRQRKRKGLPMVASRLLCRGGPLQAELGRLAPSLQEKGLRPEDFEKVDALRQRLFEIDFRFGELGSRGVFEALNRAGVLDHAVAGVDNIEHAIACPPAAGRAKARGECVRNLQARRSECVCDWSAVWEYGPTPRILDLGNPFASDAEAWEEFSSEELYFRRLYESGSPQLLETLAAIRSRRAAPAERW